jgi:choline-sulfatase
MNTVFSLLKTATLLMCAGLIVGTHFSGLLSAQPPNILLISVDDMNDWVGCLGGYSGDVHTPNIDRLAVEGMLFTNAHCAAPVCCPSRNAVFTGMMPHTTGIYNNGQWLRPHRPDITTMPMLFKEQGYQVYGAGKNYHHTAGNNPPDQWHNYQRLVRDDPWDLKVALNYPWATPVPDPPAAHPLNGILPFRHEFDWGSLGKPENQYGDYKAIDYGIDVLQQDHDKPFFLAVGTFRPHLPWYVPQIYFDMYPLDSIQIPEVPENDLEDIPEAGRKIAAKRANSIDIINQHDQMKQAIQAYLASITFADAQIGRLLDTLRASEHANNTVVVFWSDHGWHLGEKQHWHKQTLWEECTRVPFIIAGPDGMVLPGSTRQPVSLVDIYATLVDVCRFEQMPELDGNSLMPLLRDNSVKRARPAITTHSRGNHSVRSENWRYIRYADGSEELYDHRVDPNEWENLANKAQYADIKREHAKCLPAEEATNALTKSAYNFDWKQYTWERKQD